jgi:hypothetical protein
MFAIMVNSAMGISDRDEIDELSLHLLSTAELICDISLLSGMDDGLPYKLIYRQSKIAVESFANSVGIGDKEAA